MMRAQRVMLAMGAAFFGLFVIATCKAHAHPDVILQCDKNLPVAQVRPIGEPIFYENGLMGELYDRNGDGEIDIEAFTPAINNEPHSRFPILYAVDLDFDGIPDVVYKDTAGPEVTRVEDHCDYVELYEDLRETRQNPKKEL